MKENQKSPLNKAARLTGAGIQMGVTIYLCNWLGEWLDQTYNKTYFETILTLFGVFAAMYLVIVQVQKISK